MGLIALMHRRKQLREKLKLKNNEDAMNCSTWRRKAVNESLMLFFDSGTSLVGLSWKNRSLLKLLN